MTMDTKTTHTFQVTVSSDRLEDFAENLACLGVKVDADVLMRARFEGEVDLIVVGGMAEVSNFPRSWLKLPGVYVKDFYYRGTEKEDPRPLRVTRSSPHVLLLLLGGTIRGGSSVLPPRAEDQVRRRSKGSLPHEAHLGRELQVVLNQVALSTVRRPRRTPRA